MNENTNVHDLDISGLNEWDDKSSSQLDSAKPVLLRFEKPRPSNQGGLPCKLCIRIERVRQIVNRDRRFVNQSRWNRLRVLLSELNASHPKCAGCSICFGEQHISTPTLTPLGDLCGACFKLYRARGETWFRKAVASLSTENIQVKKEKESQRHRKHYYDANTTGIGTTQEV